MQTTETAERRLSPSSIKHICFHTPNKCSEMYIYMNKFLDLECEMGREGDTHLKVSICVNMPFKILG